MAIRKNISDIQEKNRQISERSKGSTSIPDLYLFNDGDTAHMMFLSDEILDVDIHEIYDPNVSPRPRYYYCSEGEESCEYCEKETGSDTTRVRQFLMWVWVDRIIHNNPHESGMWQAVKMGSRQRYQEDVNAVVLIRRKFGRGGALFNQFVDMLDAHGSLMNREFAFKRNGARGSMDTTYNLMSIDSREVPEHIREMLPNVPSLEDVARGKIGREDIPGYGFPVAAANTEEAAVASPSKTVEIPEDEEDDLPF